VNNKNDGIGKFALKLFSIIVLVSICLVALLFVICIKIQSAVYEQPFPPSLGDPHFLKAVTRSVGMPISEINKRAYIEDLGPWKAKILIDEFKPIGKLSDREQVFIMKYIDRKGRSLLMPASMDLPLPHIKDGITIGEVLDEQIEHMKKASKCCRYGVCRDRFCEKGQTK